MKTDEFVNQVQEKGHFISKEDALSAIHATLTTLAERLFNNEPEQLADQLPFDIGVYLRNSPLKEKFDLDEFYNRVSARSGLAKPEAVRAAQAVMAVLMEAVSAGEILDVINDLPKDYRSLIDKAIDIDAGDVGF
jgi:uncharacterized protein (DUF2267 family)